MVQMVRLSSIVILIILFSGAVRAEAESDLAEARALFEQNLDAIRQRDRTAYLSCYWQSERLARPGAEGLQLGYEGHAAGSSDGNWPDMFEGRDLQLVWVKPGVVYGTYRYRVRYGDSESAGISERLFIETTEGWRIAMTSAFEAPPGTPPPPRLLVGATLVDGTGRPAIPNSVVLVRSGRIECAGSRAACDIPEGVEVLNLSGFWIAPGLIDAHVHFSQTGWADGRPDALDVRDRYPYAAVQADLRARPERWFRSYLCSGVTSVFDVGGYAWTWELPDLAETDTMAPRVAAAGPLLSTLDHWLNLPAERMFIYLSDEETGRDGVRYLAVNGASAVKVWLIVRDGDDIAEFEKRVVAAGEEAKKFGLPLIVHATGLTEAKAALRAGTFLLVHSVWDQPVDDEFIGLARANRTVYTPTLIVGNGYQRMFASTLSHQKPEIDDPNRCIDAETRAHIEETAELDPGAMTPEVLEQRQVRLTERETIMAENLRRLNAAGITIAMGTDAGNPLTLHGPSVYAEMEAMESAGLSPMDVLVAATRGSAIAMGRLDDLGTLEAGKMADLVVLSADPVASASSWRHIHFVMRGGELRSIDELAVSPAD